MAHITGGGITDNLPRVLPDGVEAVIDLGAWSLPPVFQWLQQAGPVAPEEMLRTFNCGVGMLVVVADADAEAVSCCLREAGETAFSIGHIRARQGDAPVVYSGTLA